MGTVTRTGTFAFTGNITAPEDISAVELCGNLLLLGSDETNLVQVLKRQGDQFAVSHNVVLNPAAREIDIEGITHDGDTVYVAGSHSWKRKKLEPSKKYEHNLEALEKVTREPDRELLCRFQLSNDGTDPALETTTLRDVIDNNKVLQTFSEVPSKENGIDIEGLAFHDGWLYVGFRSPVLRGNLTPVLKCRFASPVSETQLVYVTLGGRGIRDLTRVNGGFLILAGPSGEGPGSYQIYLWDGGDCLPGKRTAGQVGKIELLGELSPDGGSHAEGMTLLGENDDGYEILVVFDGMTNGGPARFRVSRS